jgi:hypothetical protein
LDFAQEGSGNVTNADTGQRWIFCSHHSAPEFAAERKQQVVDERQEKVRSLLKPKAPAKKRKTYHVIQHAPVQQRSEFQSMEWERLLDLLVGRALFKWKRASG